jgi:N-acetylglucosamine-6-phosphate deacetylase
VWDQEFEVRSEGKVVVPGTSFLAGSAVFTDSCVALVQRLAGVSLREAVEMASTRPRELFNMPVPSVKAGESADLVLFRHGPGVEFQVSHTLVNGRVVPALRG